MSARPKRPRDPLKMMVYRDRSTGRWRPRRYTALTVTDFATWREAMDSALADAVTRART